jgi:hypothetical protein
MLPMTVGINGLFDVGRAFCTNLSMCPSEASDVWHRAAGGRRLSVLGRQNTVSLTVTRGEELTGCYAGAGFMF